nr:hypothetical protein [Marinicella sp. W31]MDC2877287.1 hypothetical protein [Marinicella sp. W31]
MKFGPFFKPQIDIRNQFQPATQMGSGFKDDGYGRFSSRIDGALDAACGVASGGGYTDLAQFSLPKNIFMISGSFV